MHQFHKILLSDKDQVYIVGWTSGAKSTIYDSLVFRNYHLYNKISKSYNRFKSWIWSASGLDERPVDRIGGYRPPWSNGNPCEWHQFVVRCLCVINSRLVAYNRIFTYIKLKSVMHQVPDATWCIMCQTANWRIWRQVFIHAVTEAFITPSTLRSRLYYATLHWPAWYLGRPETMSLSE